MNRECLQFREAVSDSSHSFPAQLVILSQKYLKVWEVSHHDECSLVSIIVLACVTGDFTDVQLCEFEPTECQQSSSGDLGAV